MISAVRAFYVTYDEKDEKLMILLCSLEVQQHLCEVVLWLYVRLRCIILANCNCLGFTYRLLVQYQIFCFSPMIKLCHI